MQYTSQQNDWLVHPFCQPASVEERDNQLILGNGLIQRIFVTSPNFATVDYTNQMSGSSLLRGIKPEVVLTIGGHKFEVGGLKGQPDYAYLDSDWISDLTRDKNAFQFREYRIGEPETHYPWVKRRTTTPSVYPPEGVTLTVAFSSPPSIDSLQVCVHYELYRGIPVLSKWVTIHNESQKPIQLDALNCEILAVNEQEKHRLHVESDYAFSGMETTEWGPDVDYKTQVDYRYQMPLLMTSHYPLGPGVYIQPGETFRSFRTFEILHDSDDRERKGLARRKMYRTVAPQVTENPMLMHVRSAEPDAVRLAIDQCAEVGFEMVIMTFGSGFNVESEDPEYISIMKGLADYAHNKSIQLGGYTLMCASRGVGEEFNCIDPNTGQPGSRFGQSACLASKWADGYFERVLNFMDATGMDIIETDGPYHGDVCAATTHAHHNSLADSQLRQWEACVNFYHECRARGIYINSPDQYYLNGSNKCGMGYRETNFSLPRERQILIARQNIYDGTYEKTPSMGWMFVPLVEYHGGGQAATFEPLCEHLHDYESHLAQNFGSGVIACYRGPRLYDTEQTKAVVKKWVDFFKKYRPILESDLIHVRRPDGRSIDCMLHANAQISPCGLAMLYNPTRTVQQIALKLPLYYTGLSEIAKIRKEEGQPKRYKIDRDYNVEIPIKMEAKSVSYLVIEPEV
ncbi:alpha-galactosidase [Candidatus Poribacteria bacterium]|nr:alpha-galactosidase [Candidatus Poribacteria bacterium]